MAQDKPEIDKYGRFVIQELVRMVDELRQPFNNSKRHDLYERATSLLNKLDDRNLIPRLAEEGPEDWEQEQEREELSKLIGMEPLKTEYKGVKIEVFPVGSTGSQIHRATRILYDVTVDGGYWGTCFKLDDVKPTLASIREKIDKGERLFEY